MGDFSNPPQPLDVKPTWLPREAWTYSQAWKSFWRRHKRATVIHLEDIAGEIGLSTRQLERWRSIPGQHDYRDIMPAPSTLRRDSQDPWIEHPEIAAKYQAIEASAPRQLDLPTHPVDEQVIRALDSLDSVIEAQVSGLKRSQAVIASTREFLKRIHGMGPVAAAFTIFGVRTVLDYVSDGRLDGVIVWCRILLPHVLPHLMLHA